jgi:uncharacterized protein YkwD
MTHSRNSMGLLVTLLAQLGLAGALGAASFAQADVIDTVQLLREGGCGGLLPAAGALHHDELLDRAAAKWAMGTSLQAAMDRSGYSARSTASLHLTGPSSSLLQAMRRARCQGVSDPALRDIGLYQRGEDTWLILAAAYVAPSRSQAPALARRTLELVNEARQRGARCGTRSFGPAPPVILSGTLDDVALGHAADMAAHNYFEHEDLGGHTPADRVRAVGYREKLVGENIAYGPTSAEEVVRGWLDSPGHCENIMDPRFREMGLAYAPGRVQRHGLYWVQLLAAPRA